MGMKEYDRIDNVEFAKEFGGMFSIEAERILRRTGPAFSFNGNPLLNMVRAELGLYPGTTTLGIKTRDMRKKTLKLIKGEQEVKKQRDYKYSPYKYKGKKQAAIMESLDLLSQS